MTRFVPALLVAALGLFANVARAQETPTRAADLFGMQYRGSLTDREWQSFATRFMTDDGRIKDTANGSMTHSESQGYGMLLAWMAGAAPDFERIWHFTRTQMLVRDDGLVAWSWKEDNVPHIADVNNATDGDVLIAYALILAGAEWQRTDLYASGVELMGAVRDRLVISHPSFGTVIMPGLYGFENDGLIVNPSYWIDEAFMTFAVIDPEGPWSQLVASGDAIIAAANRATGGSLPPEWVLLPAEGGVAPAVTMPNAFGYNAIRVPLYQIRAGRAPDQGVAQMINRAGELVITEPNGNRKALSGAGYRALARLIACAAGLAPTVGTNNALPEDDYYPEALRLLAVSASRVTLQATCALGRE